MNNKSITPNPQQPVDRVPTGQLPSALAELSEATLNGANVLPAFCGCYYLEGSDSDRSEYKEDQYYPEGWEF